MTTEEKTKIEVGQIYVIKDDSKHKSLPEAKTIKIGAYAKEIEEKYKLKNLWEILIKNSEGNWVAPNKPILFGQQIQAHFNLEFEPMAEVKSRLDDIED